MKKKKSLYHIAWVVAVLFLLLTLRYAAVERLQGTTVALLTPFWERTHSQDTEKNEPRLAKLELENQLLKKRPHRYPGTPNRETPPQQRPHNGRHPRTHHLPVATLME